MGSSKLLPDADGEAVCNYDTNVTTLYELLESSNWEKARTRCSSHPHEVRTWIVRRDTVSQKVRWKLLPLHAAVIFQSPTFVVSALIDQYPSAVSRRDDQGMLPLHLAFRYKEDNEDLLELLLTQYPKGVLMKDKRDRIPLEHGRGSKFSAKLLRLYAEANVSGSRALTMTSSSDSHNLKRHDLEGAVRVNEVVAEYEKRTRTLKSMYEERIQMLQDQNKAAVNQVRIASDEEKRKLVNCHVEEMEAMRDMLNSHVGNDAGVISDLESEISQLRVSLMGAKAERDAASLHATDMKSYADELALQMKQLLRDQDALQLMVSQHQLELEKAHTRREQLIQNLLRQEQDERPTRSRRGSEIKQLIESGRSNMETLLARESSPRVSPVKLQATPYSRGHAGSTDKGSSQQKYYTTGNPMTPTPLKDDISAITENSHF
jgi:ankyrin repeat protein